MNARAEPQTTARRAIRRSTPAQRKAPARKAAKSRKS
jgi:hypothetical protein